MNKNATRSIQATIHAAGSVMWWGTFRTFEAAVAATLAELARLAATKAAGR